MDNEMYVVIQHRLEQLIKSDKTPLACPPEVGAPLRKAIKKSVVLPLGASRAPKSSAMNPVPEAEPVWVIGTFGSVWCDIDIDGVCYRVGLRPDNVFEVIS